MSRTLECGICGSTFECRGLPRCWCSSVKVSSERLKEISLSASDCVCKNCLQGK